jgi:predicted permease
MDQFSALIWLKWRLFRNAMRSRKAAVNRLASMIATVGALGLALFVALGAGIAAYGFSTLDRQFSPANARELKQTADLFFFMAFAFLYLMWAIVPLGLGGGSRFDPGRLLLYPVSLGKLFVMDFASEVTSLASIFAAPVVFALALGAGAGHGKILQGLLVSACAVLFGLALAKWLATCIGTLMKGRRTRGETLLALIGATFGLAGAFLGQLGPVLVEHASAIRFLRWTPPGAIAVALTKGLQTDGALDYAISLATLLAYIIALIWMTYWIARRSALGAGGAKGARVSRPAQMEVERYAGWQLPFLSQELSALVEKEFRYAVRNAQLRTLALMPLILIGLRLAQSNGLRNGTGWGPGMARTFGGAFAQYGEGLMAATGLLYVFMILSSLACNLFGYEGGGMRTLILAPVERRNILIAKNIVVTLLSLAFSIILISINQLVFRDLSLRALFFVAPCFVLYAALLALAGNWLSIRFPKRLKFGKRMNATGVTALLLIPLLLMMALLPACAALAGYLAHSLLLKYVTLLLFACVAVALYFLLIAGQGRALARRELEILEAVSGKTDE